METLVSVQVLPRCHRVLVLSLIEDDGKNPDESLTLFHIYWCLLAECDIRENFKTNEYWNKLGQGRLGLGGSLLEYSYTQLAPAALGSQRIQLRTPTFQPSNLLTF